jgi:phosphoribosylglycinamide formyltransferase 1
LPLKIGVLVSGRGSNLEAILKAIEKGHIRGAEVAVVISNKPGVKALQIASRHGVPAVVLEGGALDREAFDRRVLDCLRDHGVKPGEGLVLLAGYMRLLTPWLVRQFEGRMMNIHPSLLPSFPGLRPHEQVLEHGAKVSGCTVHFVVPEVDSGPIIVQKAVPVRDGDTVETLSSRVLRQEHKIYPLAVKLFVEGKLSTNGRRVSVKA